MGEDVESEKCKRSIKSILLNRRNFLAVFIDHVWMHLKRRFIELFFVKKKRNVDNLGGGQ